MCTCAGTTSLIWTHLYLHKWANMKSTHEETNNIIVQHMIQAAQNKVCIKVICDDPDVLHCCFITIPWIRWSACKVDMEGASSKRNIIDIWATATKHNQILLQCLAMHALKARVWHSVVSLGCGKKHCIEGPHQWPRLQLFGTEGANLTEVFREATECIGTCYGT